MNLFSKVPQLLCSHSLTLLYLDPISKQNSTLLYQHLLNPNLTYVKPSNMTSGRQGIPFRRFRTPQPQGLFQVSCHFTRICTNGQRTPARIVRWNQGRFVKWRSVPSRARKKGFKGFILNIEENKMNTNSSKLWKIKNTQKNKRKTRKGHKYHTPWCLDSWKPPQFFLPNLLASHAHAPPHPHVRSPLFVAARGHNLGAKTKNGKKNTKSAEIICSHTQGKLYILYIYIYQHWCTYLCTVYPCIYLSVYLSI